MAVVVQRWDTRSVRACEAPQTSFRIDAIVASAPRIPSHAQNVHECRGAPAGLDPSLNAALPENADLADPETGAPRHEQQFDVKGKTVDREVRKYCFGRIRVQHFEAALRVLHTRQHRDLNESVEHASERVPAHRFTTTLGAGGFSRSAPFPRCSKRISRMRVSASDATSTSAAVRSELPSSTMISSHETDKAVRYERTLSINESMRDSSLSAGTTIERSMGAKRDQYSGSARAGTVLPSSRVSAKVAPSPSSMRPHRVASAPALR